MSCVITYLSSSSPMGHKASTICRHLPLFFVKYWVGPIEQPISSSSDVIVLLHVVLGLPLFLLPGGVQCRATLGILLGAILIACPSHLVRLCFISPPMFLHFLFLSRSLLLILLSQNIPLILHKQLLWKTSTFFTSLSIISQHSDPYRRTDFTLLL